MSQSTSDADPGDANTGPQSQTPPVSPTQTSLTPTNSKCPQPSRQPPTFNPGFDLWMEFYNSLRSEPGSLQISCTLPTKLTRGENRNLGKAPPCKTVYIPPLGTHGTYEACRVPEGWKRYVHLDGSPYWYYKGRKDVNSSFKVNVDVLTDVDLSDDELFDKTKEGIAKICNYIDKEELWRDLSVEENAPVQLVVETKFPEVGNDEYICTYYFACRATRSIFWPQVNTMDSGYASLSHFRLDMECQYWRHWEYFANIQVVTDEIYDELMNLLLYDIVVQQTDPKSNAYTFSLDELHSYVRSMEASRRLESKQSKGSPSIIGRLMYAYKRRQFSSFWGENDARTKRDPSVQARTLLIFVMSFCLFGAPDIYLDRLGSIFIDNEVATQYWRELVKYLLAEWQDNLLNSAVLLAANVAFLAIQSVDSKTENDPHYRSPLQIASYLSTMMSTSSMLVGLYLAHHIRTKSSSSIWEASDYLRRRHHTALGFEPLAIVYSLPYALLLWAVISFMVAFLLVCLLETSRVTRSLSGTVGLICLIFILWCVKMNWEHTPSGSRHMSWWSTPMNAFKHWRERLGNLWQWRSTGEDMYSQDYAMDETSQADLISHS